MSLIHKALKKAEGGDRELNPNDPPEEQFVGKKLGLKEQFTPRTTVLLVVAILCLAFTIYKKFHRPSTGFGPAPVTQIQPLPEVQTQAQAQAMTGVPQVQIDLPYEQLVEEGRKYYATGKYDEALTSFLAALAKNQSDSQLLNDIGLIYKKKNNFAQAEIYYKKALGVKPNYAECLNNLGVLKGAMGDPLEGSIYLKKAIALNSSYADAYFNLAVLNDNQGNFLEAIVNYKLFLQYTDSSDAALLNKVKERVEDLSE